MKKARPDWLLPVLLAAALASCSWGESALAAGEPPVRRPVDDVVRLWNAKLSEDFIRRHIQGSGAVYDLSVDDIVRCREAGIPESLIDVMLASRSKAPAAQAPGAPAPGALAPPAAAPPATAKAPAAPPVAAAAVAAAAAAPSAPAVAAPAPLAAKAAAPATAPPAPAATPTPAPALAAEEALPEPSVGPVKEPVPVTQPAAPRRWEGLVRRNPSVVLFKSSWDPGTLELKGESLRWSDAANPSKNLLIPLSAVTQHFLACVDSRGANDCFEWGFRTKDEVYRFRGAAWAEGDNRKVEDAYSYLSTALPAIKATRVPVKAK